MLIKDHPWKCQNDRIKLILSRKIIISRELRLGEKEQVSMTKQLRLSGTRKNHGNRAGFTAWSQTGRFE